MWFFILKTEPALEL